MDSLRLELDSDAIATHERSDLYIRELARLWLTNPDAFDQMTLTFFLRPGHKDADIGVARLIVQTDKPGRTRRYHDATPNHRHAVDPFGIAPIIAGVRSPGMGRMTGRPIRTPGTQLGRVGLGTTMAGGATPWG